MSHQKGFAIAITNYTEMQAIRAVLVEFGYPLYSGFEAATETEGYPYVIDTNGTAGAQRTFHSGARDVLTLQEFIERQAVPPKTPAQLELEKLEEQANALNAQIAKLKATI